MAPAPRSTSSKGQKIPCLAETSGGACAGVECECDRWLEVWNLVFMQYDRASSGDLAPLPAPCVDTGMGLERLAAVVQGHRTNYDSDLFQPLIKAIAERAGRNYGDSSEGDISLRVIADHLRATTFLVADGVLPWQRGSGVRSAQGHATGHASWKAHRARRAIPVRPHELRGGTHEPGFSGAAISCGEHRPHRTSRGGALRYNASTGGSGVRRGRPRPRPGKPDPRVRRVPPLRHVRSGTGLHRGAGSRAGIFRGLGRFRLRAARSAGARTPIEPHGFHQG